MSEQPAIRAAQYVRMSTDQQQYSIDNQIDAIREYASVHGIEIVKTYSDPGKSGLTLRSRPGLQRLLKDVEGEPPFNRVLIYDVSRLGRFQDADEAAAYEFHMRSHGVDVAYCVEQFGEAGTPTAQIVKQLKRIMAAEYSRDLSERISRAQAKIAREGYWVVGPAPFGYQRWAVAPDGRKMLLKRGELCHAQGWRTKLEPGPPAAVKAVRRLYQLYVDEDRTIRQTTTALNAEGYRWHDGSPFRANRIHSVIRSGVAAGDIHYRRGHRPLGTTRWVPAAPEDQVHVLGAFKAIVPRAKVKAAVAKTMAQRPSQLPDEEILDRLRDLYREHGRLSIALVVADPRLPCIKLIVERFGSCNTAFQMAGYSLPAKSYTWARGQRTRVVRVEQCGLIRLALHERGIETSAGGPTGFYVDDRKVVVLSATPYAPGSKPWVRGKYWFGRNPKTPADLAVICRVDGEPYEPVDFRVAPPLECGGHFYLRLRRHPADRWGSSIPSLEEVTDQIIQQLGRAGLERTI